jgi:hypothetical protein
VRLSISGKEERSYDLDDLPLPGGFVGSPGGNPDLATKNGTHRKIESELPRNTSSRQFREQGTSA